MNLVRNSSFEQNSFGQLNLNEYPIDPLSQILIGEQPSELYKLCEFSSKDKFSLLYRASQDGFGSNNFHSKCDGKGNTLTILKANGFIFGGFTTKSWDSTSFWKSDPNAFLFSLTNKDNKPCKMNIDQNKHQNAIYCHSYMGPSFGFSAFGKGFDIHIVDRANIVKESYSNLGYTYKQPRYAFGTNEAQSFLAGSYKFQLSEIEVYQKE